MLIIANWKMNPTSPSEAAELFRGIYKTAKELSRVQTVVCPPFVFIESLAKRTRSSRCLLGAQDVFWERAGSYTGEISPVELERSGAKYVILGHSERRAMGETNEEVSKKTRAALENGLIPIVCIGEHERDKEGEYLTFVENELTESLAGFKRADIRHLVIAYEPIWAVGAKAKYADTPEGLFEMVIFIRKVLVKKFGKKSRDDVMRVPILYGGSVDESNAEPFLREGNAAGLLIGRASLDAKKFSAILRIANNIKLTI